MNQEQEQEQKRINPPPRNEADFNMQMTDTVWGSPQISKDLRDKLVNFSGSKNDKGEIVVKKENLWGLLNFYTRDMRLANLDARETHYVRYYLDLASDYLKVNMISPFVICLSRSANVLETSQSKKGFLRKRMNTITSESFSESEAKKKTMFGKNGGSE